MQKSHLDRLERALTNQPMNIWQICALLGLSHRSANKVIHDLRMRRGEAGLPNIVHEQMEAGEPHLYFFSADPEDTSAYVSRTVSYLRTNLETVEAVARSILVQADEANKAWATRLFRDLNRAREDLDEVDA